MAKLPTFQEIDEYLLYLLAREGTRPNDEVSLDEFMERFSVRFRYSELDEGMIRLIKNGYLVKSKDGFYIDDTFIEADEGEEVYRLTEAGYSAIPDIPISEMKYYSQ